MPAYYADDLAYIHDVGFGQFAIKASPGLREWLRAAGIASGLVVDLGCGSGQWAAELGRAGYDVLGVDQSAAMLARAKHNAPRATFRKASLLDVEIPKCAAATALGEVLNYRFDKRAGRRALAKLFRRVHAALEPGGLFVFDILIAQSGPSRRSNHRSGHDWAVQTDVEIDRAGTLLTRRITSFRRVAPSKASDSLMAPATNSSKPSHTTDLYRRSEETHEQILYHPADITTDLRTAGFRVRTHRGYGQFRLSDGHRVFVAKKSKT